MRGMAQRSLYAGRPHRPATPSGTQKARRGESGGKKRRPATLGMTGWRVEGNGPPQKADPTWKSWSTGAGARRLDACAAQE